MSGIRGDESSPCSVLAGWRHWPLEGFRCVSDGTRLRSLMACVGKREVFLLGFVPYSRAGGTPVADNVADPG